MIFVTVGMHPQGFERLVRAADELAGQISEPVVVQKGATIYEPVTAEYFDFTDEEEMARWISEARLVVSHGGAGSILSVLRAQKPLVVTPRLSRYGEHIDDHQGELAGALAADGRAFVVEALAEGQLRKVIDQVGSLSGWSSPNGPVVHSFLRSWLLAPGGF